MAAIEQDEEVQEVSSGASLTYPVQCGKLRKGGFVMLKNHPCKIVEISVSKVGKHGHAKSKITGLDIFTENKYEDVQPCGHNMDVPYVTRKEYPVNYFEDNHFTLMGDTGEEIDAVYDEKLCSQGKGPAEIQDMVNKGQCCVTLLSAMGEEVVKEVKKAHD